MTSTMAGTFTPLAIWAVLLALMTVVSAESCKHLLAEADSAENPPVESPNYPFDYPSNVRECWVIHSFTSPMRRTMTASGRRILIEIKAFTLEFSTPKCIHDSLEIRDRDGDGPLVCELCGYSGCGYVTSTSDQLYLKFRSDSADEKTGFSVTYREISSSDPHYNHTTWQPLTCSDEGASGTFSSWRIILGVAILTIVVLALVIARLRRCFGGSRQEGVKMAPTKGVVMVPMQPTTGLPGQATQVQYCPNVVTASAPPAGGPQLLAPAS